ncbi:MFS transporter [Fluoribacter gormanii]|nr:MFS transporter [Fluoribacter gormanii]MCW8444156.1 MFS transporter [Fluoribacter gormanii]MCW8469340.1 MFS transporter [Fluoribacter gormanii]
MNNKSNSIVSKIPISIWILGFVSMLMDISSEMIHSLLPLFLTTTLGASTVAIGVIEGLGESTALIVKVFSGALSDYLGQRKTLAVIGYTLGALSKPLFALSPTSGVVLFARVFDRVGKGIRGAPRDALVADIAPYQLRGSSFGLRQALDTIGAVLGPLLATGLILFFANNFRAVFWVAVIPGILSVLLLIFLVTEPKIHKPNEKRINPLQRQNLSRLSMAYWWLVAIGAIFTLARFSEAFLVLRAMNVGMSISAAPFIMVIMNFTYAVSAYPFGKLADHMSHSRLLMIGIMVLIVADILLAINQWTAVLLGAALWGIHMGMTQGLLAAMVADTSPIDLRGTAYGFFNLASGLMMLVASMLAGFLWEYSSPSFTFYMGACFCVIALIGLAARRIHLNLYL